MTPNYENVMLLLNLSDKVSKQACEAQARIGRLAVSYLRHGNDVPADSRYIRELIAEADVLDYEARALLREASELSRAYSAAVTASLAARAA